MERVIRSYYDDLQDDYSDKTSLDTREGESEDGLLPDGNCAVVTIQSAKAECDVNNIMGRYAQVGLNPFEPAEFGDEVVDFSAVTDFKGAHDAVKEAEAKFMALEAKVRQRFDNDPAKLFGFLSDRANLDEAVQLGLVKPARATPPGQPVAGAAGTAPVASTTTTTGSR